MKEELEMDKKRRALKSKSMVVQTQQSCLDNGTKPPEVEVEQIDQKKIEKLSKSFDLVLKDILQQLYAGELKAEKGNDDPNTASNVHKFKDQK